MLADGLSHKCHGLGILKLILHTSLEDVDCSQMLCTSEHGHHICGTIADASKVLNAELKDASAAVFMVYLLKINAAPRKPRERQTGSVTEASDPLTGGKE